MHRTFPREQKCLKIRNFQVTDSMFNAHISLFKGLLKKEQTCIHSQMDEALHIKESRDKEEKKRTVIIDN